MLSLFRGPFTDDVRSMGSGAEDWGVFIETDRPKDATFGVTRSIPTLGLIAEERVRRRGLAGAGGRGMVGSSDSAGRERPPTGFGDGGKVEGIGMVGSSGKTAGRTLTARPPNGLGDGAKVDGIGTMGSSGKTGGRTTLTGRPPTGLGDGGKLCRNTDPDLTRVIVRGAVTGGGRT